VEFSSSILTTFGEALFAVGHHTSDFERVAWHEPATRTCRLRQFLPVRVDRSLESGQLPQRFVVIEQSPPSLVGDRVADGHHALVQGLKKQFAPVAGSQGKSAQPYSSSGE
jgi:hypothetical protein